ncbi:putative structural protein [Erwinia phage pEa_SNUABM_50]|uniref:Structural protein n=4 Tax=Eneladusvirus BF TaxID=2560751 RepID=A0A1S6UAL8_9CAUD|nr:tail tube protein [Serratia phage BF]QOI71139.1 putative structural protein [Erwinia phage pEa_SNUABM_12]QOI71683.1 putative structural protein [Erwinia phage pEa_SNUABM_47]QOI72222.1 putative structural protein [Erwinia phage pEa_SNUABM_50]QXO11348.1 hypothetical protein pEaSNUABM19_00202 [Erwinia phage pEa_SNUABM_19]QXO11896.1 hypothetical protein pEaSNUABM44_00200 [Erwinia phage pEa_SNUABM_44]
MANMMDKYGVPLPSGRNKTMSQPKIKHKFRVVVSNFGTDIDEKDHVALEASEVDRPSVSFETHQLYQFATNTSYVGRWDWKPITLTIRDSVDNKVAKSIIRQLQKQLDFQRRISAKSEQEYAGYKFRMMIETTGGANPDDSLTNLGRDTAVDAGTAITNNAGLVNAIDDFVGGNGYNAVSTIDRWVCYGCIITDISWDSLDYGSSQFLTIKLTIKPDNCVQYDMIEEMYSDRISSLLPDSVDNALDIVDKIFGSAGI